MLNASAVDFVIVCYKLMFVLDAEKWDLHLHQTYPCFFQCLSIDVFFTLENRDTPEMFSQNPIQRQLNWTATKTSVDFNVKRTQREATQCEETQREENSTWIKPNVKNTCIAPPFMHFFIHTTNESAFNDLLLVK